MSAYALLAFVGAGVAWTIVYALGSFGGNGSTKKLTVAGAALHALFSSLTLSLLIVSQQTLDQIRFWLAGSVAGRDLSLLLQVLPYIVAGLVLAFVLGRQLTVLTLGEDVASGLGQRSMWTRLGAAAAVILLAGSSVAVAGPIVFAGLVVPHLARFLVGVDYRWVLPYSALLGAMLLVCADIVGRVVLRPQELPVGIMTALVGAPLFIYLVRWRIKG